MTHGRLEQALRVYLVADPEHAPRGIIGETEAALSGGVSMVQLRAKRGTDRESVALANALCLLCRARSVPFLVNDRVDIALAVEADGVHLGVNDLPIDVARRLMGPNAIVGFSPESDDQTRDAARRGASYLGVGPVFGTTTKGDAGLPIGAETLGRRAKLSGLPVIGIGGINANNAADVVRAGAAGVAVVSAILGQSDPTASSRRLAEIVAEAIALRDG